MKKSCQLKQLKAPQTFSNVLTQRAGFTLTEVMVAVGMFGVIALGAAEVTTSLYKSSRSVMTTFARDTIVQDIRNNAKSIVALSYSSSTSSNLAACLSGATCDLKSGAAQGFRLAAAVLKSDGSKNWLAGDPTVVNYDINGQVCGQIGGMCIFSAKVSFIPGCKTPSSGVCPSGAEFLKINYAVIKMAEPPGQKIMWTDAVGAVLVNIKDPIQVSPIPNPSPSPAGPTIMNGTPGFKDMEIIEVKEQTAVPSGSPKSVGMAELDAAGPAGSFSTPVVFNAPGTFRTEGSSWWGGYGGYCPGPDPCFTPTSLADLCWEDGKAPANFPGAAGTSGANDPNNLLLKFKVGSMSKVMKIALLRRDLPPNCNFDGTSMLNPPDNSKCGSATTSDYVEIADATIDSAYMGPNSYIYQCVVPRYRSGRQIYTLVAYSNDSHVEGTLRPAYLHIARAPKVDLFLPNDGDSYNSSGDNKFLTKACDDSFAYQRNAGSSGAPGIKIQDDFGLTGVTIKLSQNLNLDGPGKFPGQNSGLISYDASLHNATYDRAGCSNPLGCSDAVSCGSNATLSGQSFNLTSGNLTAGQTYTITIAANDNFPANPGNGSPRIFTLTVPTPSTAEAFRIGTPDRCWSKDQVSAQNCYSASSFTNSDTSSSPLVIQGDLKLTCTDNFKNVDYVIGNKTQGGPLDPMNMMNNRNPSLSAAWALPTSGCSPGGYSLKGDTSTVDGNPDTSQSWDYSGRGTDSRYYSISESLSCSTWLKDPLIGNDTECYKAQDTGGRAQQGDMLTVTGTAKTTNGQQMNDTSYFAIQAAKVYIHSDDIYWLTGSVVDGVVVKKTRTVKIAVTLSSYLGSPATFDLVDQDAGNKIVAKYYFDGTSSSNCPTSQGDSGGYGSSGVTVCQDVPLPLEELGNSSNKLFDFPASGQILTHTLTLIKEMGPANNYALLPGNANEEKRSIIRVTFDAKNPGKCLDATANLTLVHEFFESSWSTNGSVPATGEDNFLTLSTDLDKVAAGTKIQVDDNQKLTEMTAFFVAKLLPGSGGVTDCNNSGIPDQCIPAFNTTGPIPIGSAGLSIGYLVYPNADTSYSSNFPVFIVTAIRKFDDALLRKPLLKTIDLLLDMQGEHYTGEPGLTPKEKINRFYRMGNMQSDTILIKKCTKP